MRTAWIVLGLASLALRGGSALAELPAEWQEWNQPQTPFRIAGNLYYVGAKEVAAYLFTTPAGHILLDGGMPETAPRIASSLEQLGFKLEDVKILLNSHAHADHAGGLAELKRRSGARLYAAAGDADLLERGGRGDFHFGDSLAFPPVKVDRRLTDGETVELGGTRLVAHLTPGHTRGCTSWSTELAVPGGQPLAVVIVGSMSVPGYTLVGNTAYPEIASDYESSFAKLRALHADIFLAPHGSLFDLEGKWRRLQMGAGVVSPFLDRTELSRYLDRTEKAFRERVAEQKAHAGAGAPSPARP
ncbi:MAG TPA: subclass B3 metallo-beta-lactamase [Thermoanaerobaculia bacterium]|nr:subclass B3 metallo-beta-lactamase [Thermoanaerobaculia bacterium]